jgi:hypothetical protein
LHYSREQRSKNFESTTLANDYDFCQKKLYFSSIVRMKGCVGGGHQTSFELSNYYCLYQG